jgi:hypothetical protein
LFVAASHWTRFKTMVRMQTYALRLGSAVAVSAILGAMSPAHANIVG